MRPWYANPPFESASLKPLLKVATRWPRALIGTSIGPRAGIGTAGSCSPGYRCTEARVWSIHAIPATMRG